MEERASGKRSNIWLKIAGFVVDKRKFIFVLFLIATVYSIFSINKVTVNQDITAYLPDDSDTRRGYDVMNSEFTTPGTAQVMISNITFEEAQSLANKIGKIEGVTSVTFDDSEACYKGSNALLTVTTEGGSEDESSIAAKNEIRDLLEGYDAYIASEIGYSSEMQDMLTEEMTGILIWAVVVVIIVMLISTKAYMLIPVLFLTFGVAVLLNMGTNYWFGEVSFITNAVAVVLQLALSIDYAIILSDRFMEEHEHMDAESAIKVALSKAIPEISSSSLTTVSGMIAMMFMQFKLGYDMGIVLVKAIIFSLIAVFFLMPGILLAFSKQIDRTHHRSLVPEINIIGKFAVKTKKIIPPLFLVVFVSSAPLGSSSLFVSSAPFDASGAFTSSLLSALSACCITSADISFSLPASSPSSSSLSCSSSSTCVLISSSCSGLSPGRSLVEPIPKRRRNSSVVAKRAGRPGASRRPTSHTRLYSISLFTA